MGLNKKKEKFQSFPVWKKLFDIKIKRGMIVKCEDKRFKKRYLEGEIVYTYSYNCNSITPRGIVILTEDTPSTSAWPYLAKHERSIVQIIALPNSKEKEEWRVKHPKLRDYFREIDKGRGYRIC